MNTQEKEFATYEIEVMRKFSDYDFTQAPLFTNQIRELYNCQISAERAFDIGCDVSAGVNFQKRLKAELLAVEQENIALRYYEILMKKK
jgi:hypothetical protein